MVTARICPLVFCLAHRFRFAGVFACLWLPRHSCACLPDESEREKMEERRGWLMESCRSV